VTRFREKHYFFKFHFLDLDPKWKKLNISKTTAARATILSALRRQFNSAQRKPKSGALAALFISEIKAVA